MNLQVGIERRDKLIPWGFTKEDEKYISLVNPRGFKLSRRSIGSTPGDRHNSICYWIDQLGKLSIEAALDVLHGIIERRDKLGTRGFAKEMEFFCSSVNPRVINLSRRSILPWRAKNLRRPQYSVCPVDRSNSIYGDGVLCVSPSLPPPHRVNELRGVTPTRSAPLRHMWLH